MTKLFVLYRYRTSTFIVRIKRTSHQFITLHKNEVAKHGTLLKALKAYLKQLIGYNDDLFDSVIGRVQAMIRIAERAMVGSGTNYMQPEDFKRLALQLQK